jgi:hypothetical protein
MFKTAAIELTLLGFVFVLFFGCASPKNGNEGVSQKLQSILIQEEKLSGTPRAIVGQLNILSRKYDQPDHVGVVIRFAPSVDSADCDITMFRKGEPLAAWLKDVCDSCGSQYLVRCNI